MNPTKAWLEQKYLGERLREYEIAALLPDFSAAEVRRFLRTFGIKRKRRGSSQFMREARPDTLERDGGQCGLCNKVAKQIHHIDGNNQNDQPGNLITLCRQCHAWAGHRKTTWAETIRAFSNEVNMKQAILAFLQKRQRATYKELEELHPSVGRIHRFVIELERKGYIIRHKDQKDKWRGPNWFTLA